MITCDITVVKNILIDIIVKVLKDHEVDEIHYSTQHTLLVIYLCIRVLKRLHACSEFRLFHEFYKFSIEPVHSSLK